MGHSHTHTQPGFKRAATAFSVCLVTYSPAFDPEGWAKDLKFVLMEKESSPNKKEAEKLVMNIDSGKQFISSTAADTAGKCKYHPNIGPADENKHGILLSTVF